MVAKSSFRPAEKSPPLQTRALRSARTRPSGASDPHSSRANPPRRKGSGSRASRRFDSLAQEAFLNLWRTCDRMQAIEEELFARHELTAQQYNALRLLGAAAPNKLPTLKLAAKLISRAPDITRMLDRLEGHGWIERERSVTDRRAVMVGLTSTGQELLSRLQREVRDCHERQLGHLSTTKLRALIAMLHAARAPHEPAESPWN